MLGLVALKTLDEFLATVPEGDKRARMTDVIDWVHSNYPDLELHIKWSQPMFTLGGTYIVGFSVASKHMAIAPEQAAITHFQSKLEALGADFTKNIIRQPWGSPFNFELLGELIDYQIATKRGMTSFWR